MLWIEQMGNFVSMWSLNELSSDRRRREIGENLNRLRTFRNRADYRDIFSGLTNTTITSIELADDVISDISRL